MAEGLVSGLHQPWGRSGMSGTSGAKSTGRKTGNLNTFDDFGTTWLESEPELAYMGAVQQTPFRGTAPMQQRAQDYWRGQYGDIFNQYSGQRAQEIATGKSPEQWTTFMDYLRTVPFTQRYSQMTPLQRGVSTRRFAPSTRHIYF